jgi:hypothetical protein
MAKIVLTEFDFNVTPPSQQTATVKYRLTSQPDVEANYTTVTTNAIVNTDGTLVTPVTISGLASTTSYTVYCYNNCGGVGMKEVFITPGPTCPAGYTLSSDGTFCYKETKIAADYVGGSSPYKICRNQNGVYNTFPMRIMKVNGYNAQGVPLTGSAYTPGSVASGYWWYNPDQTGGVGSSTVGPLNRGGIWPCNSAGQPCANNCPPENQDVGFSRQFNVPVSKVYYVGVGADNSAKLQIQDGVAGLRTIFTQNPSAIGTYFSSGIDIVFKSWLIYPVYLNAGPNILTMTAQNYAAGSAGVMAAEIYDNTEAQILAATSAANLTYLFSTDPARGFISLGDSFQAGNYSCDSHPGYSLVYDSGTNTYSCVKIDTVAPNP